MQAGATYRVSYAIDPDLGVRADDDRLTWVDSLGAVIVSDPDSGAMAYGFAEWSRASPGTMREYGNALELREPGDPASAYQEQRAASRTVGQPGDIRFALTAGPVAPNAAGRIELSLVAVHGTNPHEALAGLLAERAHAASSAATVAASAGAPSGFALRQSLGGGDGASLSKAAAGGATMSARAQLRQLGITGLSYAVAGEADVDVQIRIYSSTGQLVRRLVREAKSPGEYFVDWDALNERGARVAPGVYLAVMEAGAFRATRRLVITH